MEGREFKVKKKQKQKQKDKQIQSVMLYETVLLWQLNFPQGQQ